MHTFTHTYALHTNKCKYTYTTRLHNWWIYRWKTPCSMRICHSFVKEWTLDPSTAESLPKLVFLYHQVIGDLEVTAWIHHYTFISLMSGTKQQNAGWIYNLVFTEKLDGNSECSAFSCVSSPPNLTVLQRLISPPPPGPHVINEKQNTDVMDALPKASQSANIRAVTLIFLSRNISFFIPGKATKSRESWSTWA